MNSSKLFVMLLHRLEDYSDACTLFALLKMDPDPDGQNEIALSKETMSEKFFNKHITARQIRRSFEQLTGAGLISVQTQKAYRTFVKVNYEGVLALLDLPVFPGLPGVPDEEFPFLHTWRDRGKGVDTNPGDPSEQHDHNSEPDRSADAPPAPDSFI